MDFLCSHIGLLITVEENPPALLCGTASYPWSPAWDGLSQSLSHNPSHTSTPSNLVRSLQILSSPASSPFSGEDLYWKKIEGRRSKSSLTSHTSQFHLHSSSGLPASIVEKTFPSLFLLLFFPLLKANPPTNFLRPSGSPLSGFLREHTPLTILFG